MQAGNRAGEHSGIGSLARPSAFDVFHLIVNVSGLFDSNQPDR
jgi:hypothetical protein